MMGHSLSIRYSIGLFLLLSGGCNSLLGVDDVAQTTPDAASHCELPGSFPQVASDPSSTTLQLGTLLHPNSPYLILRVTTNANLELILNDNIGGARVVNLPGSYNLLDSDSRVENCGICIDIANTYIQADSVVQAYFARASGSLVLTQDDSAGLAGEIDGIVLRHVDWGGYQQNTTKEIDDGCTVAIEKVTFSAKYPTPPATTP